MALWQYSFHLIPKAAIGDGDHAFIAPARRDEVIEWSDLRRLFELESKLDDRFSRRASWSRSIIAWGAESGDDVQMTRIGTTGEILIRMDVRNLSYSFMGHILAIAQSEGCMILDEASRLYPPNARKLTTMIERSPSFKFVADPDAFLAKIGEMERE